MGDDTKQGQPVRRGEVVGFSGNSGRSTSLHLHFETRSLPGRLPIDPTEVYELYFTCLDHLSRFPIGAVHARLEPYRIWAPVGGGGIANRERSEAASLLDECRLLLPEASLLRGGFAGGEPTDSSQSP